MRIFKKKSKTPYQRRNKAQKDIIRFMRKRDNLTKYHQYDYDFKEKVKELNRKIAMAIDDKKLAESEIKNSPRTSYSTDNSTRIFAPSVKIGSDNTAKSEIIAFKKEGETSNKKTKTPKPSKKQKQKFNFNVFFITLTIFIVAVTVLVVFIDYKVSNCNNAAQDNACAILSTISE